MPLTSRTRIVAGVGATCLTFGVLAAPPAQAAFTPQDSALSIAQAIAVNPAVVTGASFEARPAVWNDDVASSVPAPSAGVATDLLGQFPRVGGSYGVLSTGNVASIPKPGTFSDTAFTGGVTRGDTDLDVTILKVDLAAPTGANCLSFDFKFLSEEYPSFVGSNYNDAFVAELGQSTWKTGATDIIAPNNFAFDGEGQVVSINSTGVGGMTTAEGAGTAFDGTYDPDTGTGDSAGAATTLLTASAPITPGAHSLYLSIFDQGDGQLDSAVFLDNLRIFTVPNPATDCKAGAQVVTHTMTLVPVSGSAEVGSAHQLNASVKDANGAAVTSGTVEFTVSGANNTTGSAPVVAGQASWSYAGSIAGSDQIAACYKPTGATACTALAYASFTWTPTTALPVVSVDPTSYTVNEAAGSASVQVKLSAAASGPVTVSYATANGTASAGSDYTATTGTLTIPAGSTTAAIGVPIIDDADVEGPEAFTLTLSNPAGAALGATTATITITDNDVAPPQNPAPVVDAGPNRSGVEGSSISLTGTATDTEPITVAWSAVAGAGVDAGATCTFANPASASTTVRCTDDGTWTLTLTANDGTNPPVADTMTLTVTNAAPTVKITSPADLDVLTSTAVTLRANVGDPGQNDVLACTIDWGDGTTSTGTISGGVCAAPHTYAEEGAWEITVTVADDDGAEASEAVLVTVAKPHKGKVTGGGFTVVNGRTSFGFVAKAVDGALKGQLQVKSGKNKFHGDVVSALSVDGKTATWSGTGSWNKKAGYTYTVSVIDNGTSNGGSNNGKGKGNNKGEPDSITLTVTAPDGTVVFTVSGPLQGGNLTVH